jgi:hypothetical protein
MYLFQKEKGNLAAGNRPITLNPLIKINTNSLFLERDSAIALYPGSLIMTLIHDIADLAIFVI